MKATFIMYSLKMKRFAFTDVKTIRMNTVQQNYMKIKFLVSWNARVITHARKKQNNMCVKKFHMLKFNEEIL